MIANLANTLVGLWLAITAFLNTALVAQRFGALAVITGAIIVLLSFFARRSDYHVWHSNVVITLGCALIFAGIVSAIVPLPPVVAGWACFWVGLFSAFFSLWAALYRPAGTRSA